MKLDTLVDRLWEARASGDHFPGWLNGALTLDQAQAVQLALLERRRAQGDALAGWKVGLTSPRARAALGADERPFAPLLARRVYASRSQIAAQEIERPAIEAELCFTIGRRIRGPHIERGELSRALARVAAGFEINERRRGSARPDFCAAVVDGLSQWGIAEGSGVELRDAVDLRNVRCTLLRDGEAVYEGVSRDELDDHLASLARLAAGLSAHDLALEPGQKVITGAFARFDVAPGQRWRAHYEGIGEVEVQFS
jgi:2-keto-4-pentenoate hydratase